MSKLPKIDLDCYWSATAAQNLRARVNHLRLTKSRTCTFAYRKWLIFRCDLWRGRQSGDSFITLWGSDTTDTPAKRDMCTSVNLSDLHPALLQKCKKIFAWGKNSFVTRQMRPIAKRYCYVVLLLMWCPEIFQQCNGTLGRTPVWACFHLGLISQLFELILWTQDMPFCASLHSVHYHLFENRLQCISRSNIEVTNATSSMTG